MSGNSVSFEEQLEHALAAPISPGQRAALDASVARMLRSAEPTGGRRLLVGRSLLLAAGLFLVLPVVFIAGAAIMSTEDPFGLADASEFQAEPDAAIADVPLPPGRTWPDHLRTDSSAYYSRGGARSWVEFNAYCIWLDEWVDARVAADPDRETAAARTIAEIPSWPSWNSPFWDQTTRDHLMTIITAVGTDDPAPVQRELQLNCAGMTDG